MWTFATCQTSSPRVPTHTPSLATQSRSQQPGSSCPQNVSQSTLNPPSLPRQAAAQRPPRLRLHTQAVHVRASSFIGTAPGLHLCFLSQNDITSSVVQVAWSLRHDVDYCRRKPLIDSSSAQDRPPIVEKYLQWSPVCDPSNNHQTFAENSGGGTLRPRTQQ